MKTAVSIPDHVFERAEAVAKKLEISRSELYARALAAYLRGVDSADMTERINDVVREAPQDARLDPGLAALQEAALRRSES